ncbi:MAG: DUF5134 domain-containing protein [Actinophytocola sp.]|nr:DUF5134 domain-containing protein [Actinophytocola sp.]
MDAPMPILWAMAVVFVALAVPGVVRLVRGHPAAELRCRVNRADEVAEVLLCLGMLAMVLPIGAPVPLAGWQALFGLAALWLSVSWVRARRVSESGACVARQCGHHAICAVVMLYMLLGVAGHTGHDGDPWLTMAGHTGVLPLPALAAAAAGYLFVDMARCTVLAARDTGDVGAVPVMFRARIRHAARAVMGVTMGIMLLSMT